MALHWQILLGMALGIAIGLAGTYVSWGTSFISDWIKPFGQIFINLLKLIAVPLVFISLSKGILDLKDLSTLSKIGGRAILYFILTTVFAVLLGLVLVNIFEPGAHVNPDTLTMLTNDIQSSASGKLDKPAGLKGPLDFLVKMVPQNIIEAAGTNSNMLQVIFFTVFFSISLLLLPSDKQVPLKNLFDSLNDVLIKMVDLIMLFAPIAVLALMASLITETTNAELFVALLGYALVLILGMIILLCFYAFLIKFFTPMPVGKFLKGIFPAQLVALTTSSSMATLPITMECVEDNLGVDKEITSFVCPVGATVNMDATSLMQAIASVFICQVMGHALGITDFFTIILTASLASIGAAAAPSAGIVMLIMVLESVGFPSENLPVALAMILAVDRPLDMGRTVVNISGDSCVSVLVAKSLGKL